MLRLQTLDGNFEGVYIRPFHFFELIDAFSMILLTLFKKMGISRSHSTALQEEPRRDPWWQATGREDSLF